eukprot:NP_492054.2 TWiK family of potassium channels [Caenorhabditis elegans]
MTFNDGDNDRIGKEEEHAGLIENQIISQKTKKQLPSWLDRPYHVWRDQFQQDKCCPKKMVKRELMFASTYVLILNVALILYVLFGCQVFDLRHSSTNNEASFLDRALFCITTISTIGYGNIAPFDDRGKVICILYCVAGIPLFFMTVATNSVLVVDICNIVHRSYSSQNVENSGFRWYTSAILLAAHCFIGALIFSLFISITTIGYGDYSPTPEGLFQYIIVTVYLCTGVATMLLFFASLQKGIMWIHYYGRKVSDSEEAEIWFGGQMMTVKDLVTLVAEKFGSTPEKLREVLHDLDKILEVACKQAEEDDDEEDWRSVNNSEALSPPAPRKKTVFLSGSSDGDDCQATIHSFTSTNQRSIPKDTELAILALGTIQHHLRKPSVRGIHGHHHHPKIPFSKPASDSNIESKEAITSLDLRKKAHRVHSDGRLLLQQDV